MSMTPVRFGSSGLKVSPLSLGTMMFGTQTDLSTARSIADLCLERGAFFWDTADMYGLGASEQICADLLRERRAQVVLATKVYAAMSDAPNDGGLSARNIIAACEASLRRLGTDWIDLYYLHVPDREVPLEETLRAMEDLVRAGKVRYVGASNYRAWEVVELLCTARQHGWQPITGIQPLYNLVNRDIEVELLPMAARFGLGVATYAPLARGILTNKYAWDAPPPAGSRLARQDRRFLQAEWREASIAVAAQLAPLAAARDCTPGQLATAWALRNTQIHSVIIGPRTLAHAEEALGAVDVVLDEEVEQAVDALVPPGTHSGGVWPDENYYPVVGRQVR